MWNKTPPNDLQKVPYSGGGFYFVLKIFRLRRLGGFAPQTPHIVLYVNSQYLVLNFANIYPQIYFLYVAVNKKALNTI